MGTPINYLIRIETEDAQEDEDHEFTPFMTWATPMLYKPVSDIAVGLSASSTDSSILFYSVLK